MIGEQKQLKAYRKAISEAWLPVVGRKKLKSAEYERIEEWFTAGTPLDLVLRAIRQCAERARSKRITISSLGVIRADIEQLRRRQASMRVGGNVPKARESWRESWLRDLPLFIEEMEFTGKTEAAEYLKQLQSDLPGLDEDQARARLHEFQQKFR